MIHVKIENGRGVEGQQLADKEAADDREAQRAAEFSALAEAQRQRYRAENCGRGRHHDWTKPQQAGVVDGVVGIQMVRPFCFDGKIDHYDCVLFDDADQQDHADQADDVKLGAEEHQRQQGANACGRQCRQDGDRVDVALVQHAEEDVDGGNRRKDQDRLLGERLLKQLRRPGERTADRTRAYGCGRWPP